MTDEDAAGSLLADGEPSTRAVFMVDPSAEAEHVAQLLRGMGCVVVDVPMSMLVARIAVQKPRVVIMDADVKEAADTVKTVRAMPGGTTIALVLLGQEKPPVEEGHASVGATSDAFFRRPIRSSSRRPDGRRARGGGAFSRVRVRGPDVGADFVRSREAPGVRARVAVGSSRPALARPGRHRVERKANLGPPPAQRRCPRHFGCGERRHQHPVAAQRRAEMLLLDAEQRLTSQSLHEPAPPSPDEELEAVLPAELLAALDEPIEDDAEDFALDAGLSRGEAEAAVGSGVCPHPRTQGARSRRRPPFRWAR